MPEFQNFDLGRVLQTAEAIKSIRNDSVSRRLQQQYLGNQNAALEQNMANQTQDRAVALDQKKAEQAYLTIQHAKRQQDPKAFLLQEPGFTENWQKQGVDVASMDDGTFKQFLSNLEGHVGGAAGVTPTPQMQTIGDTANPGAGILQRDPATGALKQITAPQKPDNSGERLGETKRHNQAMEQKGNQPASADNVETAAQAISNYQQAPLGAFAMRSPYGQAVMAKVMEINPDYQANEFGSRSKAYKDFASGKNGNQVRSFNVAISHLDSLQKVADAMDNGDVPILNKLRNEFSRQTGKEAPNTFDGMKKIVTDEIVKSIVGAGGGVADREEASKTISAANSPAQLAGIMNGYKELMAGQLGGLKQQYEQTTGRKDFERFLTGEAKGYLSSHELSSAPPQQSQSAPTATGPNGQKVHLVNGQWVPQ